MCEGRIMRYSEQKSEHTVKLSRNKCLKPDKDNNEKPSFYVEYGYIPHIVLKSFIRECFTTLLCRIYVAI